MLFLLWTCPFLPPGIVPPALFPTPNYSPPLTCVCSYPSGFHIIPSPFRLINFLFIFLFGSLVLAPTILLIICHFNCIFLFSTAFPSPHFSSFPLKKLFLSLSCPMIFSYCILSVIHSISYISYSSLLILFFSCHFLTIYVSYSV